MKKKKIRLKQKLVFNKEVISSLSADQMQEIAGGATYLNSGCGGCETLNPRKCAMTDTGGGDHPISYYGNCTPSVNVCDAP